MAINRSICQILLAILAGCTILWVGYLWFTKNVVMPQPEQYNKDFIDFSALNTVDTVQFGDRSVAIVKVDADKFVALINGDEAIGEVVSRDASTGDWLLLTSQGALTATSTMRNGTTRRLRQRESTSSITRRLFIDEPLSVVRWPGGIVPYSIEPGFDKAAIIQLQVAMTQWMNQVPVQFVKKQPYHTRWVAITPLDMACYSYVGELESRQNIGQVMGVDRHGNCGLGSMLHELGHLLCQFHEQQRPDRDKYVRVLSSNVASSQAGNFELESDGAAAVISDTYDFGSIMQYSSTSFTANGADTMEPVPDALQAFVTKYPDDFKDIGQRIRLSTLDVNGHTVGYSACVGEPEVDPALVTNKTHWLPQPWGPWVSQTIDAQTQSIQPAQQLCKSVRRRTVSCVSGLNQFLDGCRSMEDCAGVPMPNTEEYDVILHTSDSQITMWTFDNEVGMQGFQQGKAKDGDTPMFEWSLSNGGLGGGACADLHPPPGDHTSGLGNYVYARSSVFQFWPRVSHERGSIETPLIHWAATSSGQCRLSFWYYFHGSVSGRPALSVDMISCSRTIIAALWSEAVVGVEEWRRVTFKLPEVQPLLGQGENFSIRFTAWRGDAQDQDIALDDISLTGCFAQDPCDSGFTFDGDACVDIDECATGNNLCHSDAFCSNVSGSYNCACQPGYMGNPYMSCSKI